MIDMLLHCRLHLDAHLPIDLITFDEVLWQILIGVKVAPLLHITVIRSVLLPSYPSMINPIWRTRLFVSHLAEPPSLITEVWFSTA